MTDLVNYSLSKLPSQFEEKPNWKAYFKGVMATPQWLDKEGGKLTFFDIDKSEGIMLDLIGEFLDVKREDRDDASYRPLLKLQAKLNNSTGTANFFMFAFKALIPFYRAFYTAGEAEVIMFINYKAQPPQDILYKLVDLLPAGVGLIVKYTIDGIIFESDDNGKKRITQAVFADNESFITFNGEPFAVDYFNAIDLSDSAT